MAEPSSSEAEYADRIAAHWAKVDTRIRSFWQSRVVMAEINRRVSGDPSVSPLEFFRREYCFAGPRRLGLSLGSGDGQLEIAAVDSGICERVVGIDIAPERVRRAMERVPERLRDRVTFVVENLETYRPDETYDIVFCKSVLHHIEDLEGWCDAFATLLGKQGLLYVDDFIGPDRFQWTDTQLYVINRLLDALPEELRRDLVAGDGAPRPPVGRPSVELLIRDDPSEAIRPSEIAGVLATRLQPLDVRDVGGALYHQFFNRIMGNFEPEPALVRMIMEVDFLLTDLGVLAPNYLWGVYRA
jgi:SAM-dependent methyltransferase